MMTNRTLIPSSYAELLKKVKETLLDGQQRIESERVRTYWETGRIIHGHILLNKDRAEYGARIIAELSRDLHVDRSQINRCVRFYKQYPALPIGGARPKLGWTHYRKLIAVSDDKERLLLEKEASRNQWSADELAERIKRDRKTKDQNQPASPSGSLGNLGAGKLLTPKRGELYTYRIVTRPTVGAGEDSGLLIDLGFGIFRECDLPAGRQDSRTIAENDIVRSSKRDDGYRLTKIEATASALFTYNGFVERVIDGDTLKVRLDLGFSIFSRHTLRLRGIDCPEMSTKAGEVAKVFVQSYINPGFAWQNPPRPNGLGRLIKPRRGLITSAEVTPDFSLKKSGAKEAQRIVVRSSRSDKYDRYLADVFLPGEGDKFIYLNNLLLEQGQAVRMS